MKLEPAELDTLLEESGALRRGHFLLSSGLHSPAYVQGALLLQDPLRARRVGEALAGLLAPLRPQSVLSPALGGVIIGHEVAAALGVAFRFTERVGGRMELRRGFELEAGERLVVVEDVVTTGRSGLEVMGVAAARRASVLGLGAIIDRTGGGVAFPVPFHSLSALDLPAYRAADCPLCRRGVPVQKPGSRPVPAPG